jgi:predicted phosphodiesterase
MNSHKSRLFFNAFILLTLASANIGMPSCLNVQPEMIHLSLNEKTTPEATSPVIVTWDSDNSGGNQYIKYGLTSDPEKIIRAGKTELHDKIVFKANLDKLKHGTKYYYKVGSDKAGWSPVYSFNSEPDTCTFRVAVIGDTQNNTNNNNFNITKIISDLVLTYSPSFTLHMGDIVDDGSIPACWSGFLSVTQDLNAVSPLMPVLGNHDVQNNTGNDFQSPFQDYYLLFNLPGDEVNYSFTYANVRFIGIFSGCAQIAEKVDKVRYKPGSPEYLWLEKELVKAERDKNIYWTILWMHYPVYSFGWSNVAGWKENILPLLEKHKVDLCLAGHRHIYERHFQIKNGIPLKNIPGSTFSASDGTIYITNGTAGGNPTGPGGNDQPDIAFTPNKNMYSFAIIDINRDSINYSVFDQDNALVDRFVIRKGEVK